MHEIKTDMKLINGKIVQTFSRKVINANILEVEAGTNGYKGGDSGHGSRTYFRIKDLDGTVIQTKLSNDDGIEIILAGDSELDTFIKALKFATKVLEDQVQEIND